MYNGTAELCRKSIGIDIRFLFLINVVLVERDNNGNAKLEKLCGIVSALAVL